MKKLLILCLIIVFIISISFGKSFISIWNVKPEQLTLLYQIRLPHAILAFICGASLSVAGSVYQGLFRNNLASPYTLGIASGASLGAYLAYLFNFPFIFIFSFLGAIGTLFIIFVIPSLKGMSVSINKFLLTGVCLSFILSSFILFTQYLMSSFALKNAMHFIIGDISIVGWEALYYLIPVLVICFIILFKYHNELSLISISESHAKVQGVAVKKVQFISLIVASFLVAAIISYCGPIGFVGIIIPNIFRKYFPSNYCEILIGSFLAGGIFLLLMDLLSRTIISQGNFPIGIITSVIGGPIFLMLLLRSEKV